MDGADVAALIAAVAVAVLVTALLFTLRLLNSTLRSVRDSVDELHRTTIPLLQDAHRSVLQASNELERVDEVLESAQSISKTLDSASRLAYLAFSSPLAKAMAFGTGAARAWKRFKKDSK